MVVRKLSNFDKKKEFSSDKRFAASTVTLIKQLKQFSNCGRCLLRKLTIFVRGNPSCKSIVGVFTLRIDLKTFDFVCE